VRQENTLFKIPDSSAVGLMQSGRDKKVGTEKPKGGGGLDLISEVAQHGGKEGI